MKKTKKKRVGKGKSKVKLHRKVKAPVQTDNRPEAPTGIDVRSADTEVDGAEQTKVE